MLEDDHAGQLLGLSCYMFRRAIHPILANGNMVHDAGSGILV